MENRSYPRQPSRLSAAVIILAAVFGLVISTAGLVVLWTTQDTVITQVSEIAALSGRTLEATHQMIGTSNRTLSQASRDLELINALIGNLTITLDNSSDLLSSTGELVGTDMIEFVGNTQTSLVSVENSAGLIDDFLGVISAVPFIGGRYRPDVPLQESVQRVSRSMDSLPEAFEQIQRDLDTGSSNAAILRGQVSGLGKQIIAIQTNVDDARKIVVEYQDIFSDMRQRFEGFEEALPARLNLIYWVLSAFLAWVLLSQLGALLHGISMLRG